MEFSPGTVGTLLIVAIMASIAAIVVGVLAIQSERRVRAAYGKFARGRREDVITLIEMHIDEVQRLQHMFKRQQAHTRQLRGLVARTLSRVGTVRYDAFDDMGGRLSFSMALLDEHGDGIVLTAMNGRVQTRTYAKPVKGGTSSHNLSEEEVEAIGQAMSSGARRVQEVVQALPTDEDLQAAGVQPGSRPTADGSQDPMAPPEPVLPGQTVAVQQPDAGHAGEPGHAGDPGHAGRGPQPAV